MKLASNLAAGFAHSVWTAVLGLAVVPFYLHYLGIEAYGLIGFFAAMQALFALLDMGLSPTMNREVARAGASGDRSEVRDLLHTLALVYWVIAAFILLFTITAAPWLAEHWLNSVDLPSRDIERAIMLIGAIIAVRFPLGLYLGAVMGAHRLALASWIGIVMITVANAGAVAVLAFLSPTIQAFFIWQAIAGFAYVMGMRSAAWHCLAAHGVRTTRFNFGSLKRIWRFSAGMGATALLGTIFMQSDKVILSKLVSLDELGRYTLAGLAARSLYLFLTPVFSAVYPRLTALAAADSSDEVVRLYRDGTRLLMAVIFPLATYVAIFSTEVFWLWTGDLELARSVDLVVDLLLLGTALNGAMHFPYALQLAYGKARLPVTINLILIVVFAPLVILLSLQWGIVGGAAAWAVLNFLYVLLGTWITHRSILQGLAPSWLLADVGLPLLVAAAVVGIGGTMVRNLELPLAASLGAGGILTGVATMLVVALSPRLVMTARQVLTRGQGFGNGEAA